MQLGGMAVKVDTHAKCELHRPTSRQQSVLQLNDTLLSSSQPHGCNQDEIENC